MVVVVVRGGGGLLEAGVKKWDKGVRQECQ